MAFTGDAKDVVQLTMKFDGDDGGWSEKVYFQGANNAAMNTAAVKIINYRIRFLPRQCKITAAVLSTLGKPRGGKEVQVSYPVTGLWYGNTTVAGTITQNENINNPDNAIRLRFENSGEDFASRWIHGIPDAQVNASRIVDTIASASTAEDTIPAVDDDTVDGWGVRVNNYMRLLFNSTKMVKRTVTNARTVFQTDSIAVVISKGYARHKTGRPTDLPVGRASPR